MICTGIKLLKFRGIFTLKRRGVFNSFFLKYQGEKERQREIDIQFAKGLLRKQVKE